MQEKDCVEVQKEEQVEMKVEVQEMVEVREEEVEMKVEVQMEEMKVEVQVKLEGIKVEVKRLDSRRRAGPPPRC